MAELEAAALAEAVAVAVEEAAAMDQAASEPRWQGRAYGAGQAVEC